MAWTLMGRRYGAIAGTTLVVAMFLEKSAATIGMLSGTAWKNGMNNVG